MEFHAAGNLLTDVPVSIKHLQNLEVLDLKKNKISNIPQEFGFLSRLLKLDLEENQITTIS